MNFSALPTPTQPPKPSVLPIQPGHIPVELKALAHWVNWRLEFDGERWTKVPYQPSGKKASSTSPATWTSFGKALSAYESGKFDGIDFVPSPKDDFTGVDLDSCLDPETGEIQQWAKDIVNGLGSYTEKTPSGTGLRIFVKAALAKDGYKKGSHKGGGIEVYCAAHYLTLTGYHLEGTPLTIEPRQSEIDALVSKEFPEKGKAKGLDLGQVEGSAGELLAKALANLKPWQAGRLLGLLNEPEAYSKLPSPSERDYHAVSLLVQGGLEDAEVAAVWRASELGQRDKVQKRDDYVIATIANANLGGDSKMSYNGISTWPLELISPVNAAELGATDGPGLMFLPVLGEPGPLLNTGFIIEGFSHILAGYPKVGKTEFVSKLARDWGEQGKSVLFITEEAQATWRLRIKSHPSPGWEKVMLWCALGAEPSAILEHVRQAGQDIVVIDTLRNLLRIRDEKDNSEIASKILPFIQVAREGGKTPILVHHLRKGGGEHGEAITGGHAFLGVVDVALEITRDEHSARRRVLKGWGRIVEVPEMLYELTDDGEFTAVGEPEIVSLLAVKTSVLDVLDDEWLKTSEVRDALGGKFSLEQLRRALTELAQDKQIERDPDITKEARGKVAKWRKVSDGSKMSSNGIFIWPLELILDGPKPKSQQTEDDLPF